MTRPSTPSVGVLGITAPVVLLLSLLPASVAGQIVTTQGVDRVGDLTLKITQTDVPAGASVLYNLNASVSAMYRCTRKGQSIPLDVSFGTEWVEQWTAQAKPTGTIRTAVTLLLPESGLGNLCSEGWTLEPTWVRYSNLFLFDSSGVIVSIRSYERQLK